MSNPEFIERVARVEGGRLPVWVWDEAQRYAQAYEGRDMIITVKVQKRKRSVNLNAFYWGFIVTPIMQELRNLGNMVDVEETHEFLKAHVGKLKQVIVTTGGEVHFAPGSTKKMTGSELVQYIEVIRVWAAEVLGMSLPFPNEHPDTVPQPTQKG